MSEVMIFWEPTEQNSLSTTEYIEAIDGDTPIISTSIRMLSIDTPETEYPWEKGEPLKPSSQDDNLVQLAQWIKEGKAPIEKDLGKYLIPKLETGKAGTLQEKQGKEATKKFEEIVNEQLEKPEGEKRGVYILTAAEPLDQYGRLLAYMEPSYTEDEREEMTREERVTFNHMMVESGWAASFIIYPSLLKYIYLAMFYEAAKDTFEKKRGAWGNTKTLTGYEFRMCVKLYRVTKRIVEGETLSTAEKYSWIDRYCVDMTTRKIYNPQDYIKVKPYKRIFIWSKNVSEAVGTMNLIPG